ncbi:hypothetical protein BJP40_02855 [Streptomyces sp. CC53]|uniref:nuclear transport factor 2 family protein n=1 Tax=unclassified Streptomyces TaxID=2593676 RepID=UPI0008DDCECD|nr:MULTISPECIES: nuclear transport factor 2 family protein [unclassified Streptomyces]OII61302.1 hypothetical protein BJP39_30275 [Streptomyces sp. CC77]OII63395.1 hypothetical protein BJP40_02855 [Streptomyces sp. CC53]
MPAPPTTDGQVAPLGAPLGALADRLAIKDLFDRYVEALDRADEPAYDDDWYRTVFTEDARLAVPAGTHRGVRGFADFRRTAKARWGRTGRLGGTLLVDLDGDRARARAHQVASHRRCGPDHQDDPYVVSGYYDARALRTADGWRLDALAFHVVSALGRPVPTAAEAVF